MLTNRKKTIIISLSICVVVAAVSVASFLIFMKIRNRIHRELCLSAFEDFRQNVKPGMTSQQVGEALKDKEWMDKACICPIFGVFRDIPLKTIFVSSIGFQIVLYPDSDNQSNYVIYFALSRTSSGAIHHEQASKMGIDFLNGKLEDNSVILEEFALCDREREGQEEVFSK